MGRRPGYQSGDVGKRAIAVVADGRECLGLTSSDRRVGGSHGDRDERAGDARREGQVGGIVDGAWRVVPTGKFWGMMFANWPLWGL